MTLNYISVFKKCAKTKRRKQKTEKEKKMCMSGNSLAFQWLGLRALMAEGPGSTPGRGTKIPQAAWCDQKQKKKKEKMCMKKRGNCIWLP